MRTVILFVAAGALAMLATGTGCGTGGADDPSGVTGSPVVQIKGGIDGASAGKHPGEGEFGCPGHDKGNGHGNGYGHDCDHSNGHGHGCREDVPLVEDAPDATEGEDVVAADLPPDTPPADACEGPFEIRVSGVVTDGGYALESFRAGPFIPGDQPLLHVVGIYQSTSAHSSGYHPMADAVLHVGPTQRPLVLALSSYEPVHWVLELDEDARVERVVLLGYHPQAFTAHGGAQSSLWLEDLSNGETDAYGYCWPSCDGGSDTSRMIRQVESVTGLTVEAFDGIYHLEKMTIAHACEGCTSACGERECGADGCGGYCGQCQAGDSCRDDGQCIGPDDDADTGTCPGPFALRFFEALTGDGYAVSSYRAGDFSTGDEPLLHMIGQYESSSAGFLEGPSDLPGRTVLHIGPTQRPVVLALNSYEATEWVLDLDPAAVIQSVLLTGYKAQTLIAPAGIPVTNQDSTHDYYKVSYAYCWPFCDGGSNTPALVERVEAATGLKLAAFDGAYTLGEAWIHHTCTGCTPGCGGRACGDDGCGGTCGTCGDGFACSDDGRCLATSAPEPCDGLPSDPHYCLALMPTGAALFGLESGSLCSLGPQDGRMTAAGMGATSIAWQGDFVFACNRHAGYEGLMRYSLVDGSYDLAPEVPCIGVASWHDALVVLVQDPGFRLRAYATFADAVAGNAMPLDLPVYASRVTVRGDTAYAAWHSTNEILQVGLADGIAGAPIPLEDFNTWVQGLSVTDDDLLVVNGWWPDRRVAVFDVRTGAALWNLTDLPLDTAEFTGLACRAR